MWTRKFVKLLIIICIFLNLSFGVAQAEQCNLSNQDTQNIFSMGRSLGVSYYYLAELIDKSEEKSYMELRRQYQKAFEYLNIADIIIDELALDESLKQDLDKLRASLYCTFNKQNISAAKLEQTVNLYRAFYENFLQAVSSKYCKEGNWLLDLGFYTSFQRESVTEGAQEKLLLSGFSKISENMPFIVPADVLLALKNIKELDKPELTTEEIKILSSSATRVIEYFTGYPDPKALVFDEMKLHGVWKGVMLNPNCEKFNITFKVNKDMSAVVDIDKIAKNVPITSVELVDGYFTFTFKPFGTEKFYIKFNAKVSDSMFTGEITNSIGEKGYWVVAKSSDSDSTNENLSNVISDYIEHMETKIRTTKKEKSHDNDGEFNKLNLREKL